MRRCTAMHVEFAFKYPKLAAQYGRAGRNINANNTINFGFNLFRRFKSTFFFFFFFFSSKYDVINVIGRREK